MLKIILPLTICMLLSMSTWRLLPPVLFLLSVTSMSYYYFFTAKQSLNNTIFIDSMALSLILLTLWVTAMMVSITLNFLAFNMSMMPTFTILLCLVLTLAFSASNLLLFYIMFEFSLVPTAVLIILYGYQPERMQAVNYMMIYTISASLPLLMLLLALYTTNLHTNLFVFNWHTPEFTNPKLLGLFASLAFLVKIPLYSLHLWLPKAHVEAPTAGSMILASVLLKLGSFGLLRMLSALPDLMSHLALFITSLGAWGAALTGLICIRQVDFKAMIAYSSVAHMSLMVAGIMTYTYWGWTGAFILIVSHGLCSSALFALAGMTYEMTHSRSLFLVSGLSNIFPNMTLWWFIFCVCNMAAPPFVSLVGEIAIFSAIISKSFIFASIIIMSSFLAAAYNLHLYTCLQHGPVPQYMNTQLIPLTTHHSTSLLHFLPIGLLSLKPDLLLWP